jgi:Outer membrane lipoprotein carrier protein LolA-like
MNSGIVRKLIFVLLMACAFAARGAEPWGLQQLMIELGRVKEAKGTFVERKYLKVLSTPLESTGTLEYYAPHRLEKRTLAPKPESLLMNQDILTLESRSRKRSLQIQDYPVLWAFVESIRGTLKGDLSALNQFYRVGFDGNAQAWQLVMQPIDTKMAALIKAIRISGSQNLLKVVEVEETDGDRSVMTITGDIL